MITFHIEKDGLDFHTWTPELQGCHSHGKTPQIAMKNLKGAISLYLEDCMEESFVNQQVQLMA